MLRSAAISNPNPGANFARGLAIGSQNAARREAERQQLLRDQAELRRMEAVRSKVQEMVDDTQKFENIPDKMRSMQKYSPFNTDG